MAASATPDTGDTVPGPIWAAFAQSIERLRTEVRELRNDLTSKRKQFYSVDEVAELLGRSSFTVRRWLKEGRIEARRIEGTGPRGKLLIAATELPKLVRDGLGSSLPDLSIAGE